MAGDLTLEGHKMKHIKPEQFGIIEKAAEFEAMLDTGSRNQLERKYRTIIRLAEGLNVKDVNEAKLPKKYAVLAKCNVNIGTKKWSHVIEEIEIVNVDASDKFQAKWTEKSIVTYNYYGEVSRVVSRQKIIGLIY